MTNGLNDVGPMVSVIEVSCTVGLQHSCFHGPRSTAKGAQSCVTAGTANACTARIREQQFLNSTNDFALLAGYRQETSAKAHLNATSEHVLWHCVALCGNEVVTVQVLRHAVLPSSVMLRLTALTQT
jgi:hypothetical protein